MAINRVLSVCERNVTAAAPSVIAIPNATSTQVVPDTRSDYGEISYIGIQNVGANTIYYALGIDCDSANNFHGMLAAGQSVPVPVRTKVCCYCPTSTSIVAVTILKRRDTDNVP